jgi:hypothetical protein
VCCFEGLLVFCVFVVLTFVGTFCFCGFGIVFMFFMCLLFEFAEGV